MPDETDPHRPVPGKRGRPEEAGEDGGEPVPPAGPHARPELTNPDATPGAGALPDPVPSRDVDGGAG